MIDHGSRPLAIVPLLPLAWIFITRLIRLYLLSATTEDLVISLLSLASGLSLWASWTGNRPGNENIPAADPLEPRSKDKILTSTIEVSQMPLVGNPGPHVHTNFTPQALERSPRGSFSLEELRQSSPEESKPTLTPEARAEYIKIIDSSLTEGDFNSILAKNIRKDIQDAVKHDITPQKGAISELIRERFDIFNSAEHRDLSSPQQLQSSSSAQCEQLLPNGRNFPFGKAAEPQKERPAPEFHVLEPLIHSLRVPTVPTVTAATTEIIDKPNLLAEVANTTWEDSEQDLFTFIKHACIVYRQQINGWTTDHFRSHSDSPASCSAVEEMKSKKYSDICDALPSLANLQYQIEVEKEFGWVYPVTERTTCVCHGNELQIAIATRDPGCVEEVLKRGRIDLNMPSGPDGHPLTAAANRGLEYIVEILIAYGARINNPSTKSNSILAAACNGGHFRIVETLLRYPVHVHEVTSVLRDACYSGSMELVATLLRWRNLGNKYNRKSLPLAGCIQSAVRKKFGSSITDVCSFLHMEATEDLCERDAHDYMQACIIIEMLVQAGAQHKIECSCDRNEWRGGHRIIRWRQMLLEQESPLLLADPPEIQGNPFVEQPMEIQWANFDDKDGSDKIDRGYHSDLLEHTIIEPGKFKGFQKLKDGSFRDARGWYWASPEAYIASYPKHNTWFDWKETPIPDKKSPSLLLSETKPDRQN